MSISPQEGVEYFEASDHERLASIIPFIARDRLRLRDGFGLRPDMPLQLQAPSQNTYFSIESSEHGDFLLTGWEETALSADGKFPEELADYSDGFDIVITPKGLITICPYDGGNDETVRRLSFEQIRALKTILWGSKIAHLDEIVSVFEVEDDEEVEARLGFENSMQAILRLRDQAETLQAALLEFDELATNKVITRKRKENSGNMVDVFSAKGTYRGDVISAAICMTPSDLLSKTPPAERAVEVKMRLPRIQPFIGVDNIAIPTARVDFFFDTVAEEVNMVPRDSKGYRIALDEESTQYLANILESLVPMCPATDRG